MKADFIPKFIETIIETGKEINDMWNWRPLYYKGVKVKGHDYRKVYNGFKNLQRRGIIDEISKESYRFTKKGEKWLSKSLLKYHKLNNTRWDHKWRVIIFDIPQELHNERNKLRQRFKYLGFYMIQKSVFVFPYSCEEELSEYCSKLKVGGYVNVILAEDLGYMNKEVIKFFALS